MVIKMEIEKKIEEVLETIRPILVGDGGDIKFVKFDNGTVYIKLLGHCATCPMRSYTIKEGIASSLINEIEEVTNVVNIED